MNCDLPKDIFYVRSSEGVEIKIDDLIEDESIVSYSWGNKNIFGVYSGTRLNRRKQDGVFKINRADVGKTREIDFEVDEWQYCLRVRGVKRLELFGSVSDYRKKMEDEDSLRGLMKAYGTD
jgi:hypothetical protein